MSITEIPVDVLREHVAPHLDPVSACRASQTCRKMNEAFSSDRVWTDYAGQFYLNVDQKNASEKQVSVKQRFRDAVRTTDESFHDLLKRVGGQDRKNRVTIYFLQQPGASVEIYRWKTDRWSNQKMVSERVFLKGPIGNSSERKNEELKGVSARRGLICLVRQFPEGEKLEEFRAAYKNYRIPCIGG